MALTATAAREYAGRHNTMRIHTALRGLLTAFVITSVACDDTAPVAPPVEAPSLTITPPAASVYEADALTFTAAYRNAQGDVVPNAPVTWTVSDALRAELGANGSLLALRAGSVDVVAKSGTVTARYNLVILRPPVERVEVLPTTPVMTRGDVATIGVRVGGPAGRTISGRVVTLVSDNPAIALIDAAGRVRASTPGVAMIRATSEGVTGTARVEVTTSITELHLSHSDGTRLPVLVHSDSVYWHGVREFHEVYMEVGKLVLSGAPQLAYEIDVRYAEYNVVTTNGQRRLDLRTTLREHDRGIVQYDVRGDLQLTSTYVGGLSHMAFPGSGGMQVQFSVPGDDHILQLFYRREP